MCLFCSQNAWKQFFFSVGNSDLRDHINRCGVTTIFVSKYFFRRTESIFNQKFCVFPQKCPFFHNFNFEDLSKAVTEFFFGRTPFELKPSIKFFWTYNAEINQRKPMPCFSIIWLQNQSLWCFFSTKHRNSFPLQFPILRFLSIFFIHSVWICVSASFCDTSEWQGFTSL